MLIADDKPRIYLRLPLSEVRRREVMAAREARKAHNRKTETENVQLVGEMEGAKAAARAKRSLARDPLIIAVTRLFWDQDLSDLPSMQDQVSIRAECPAPSCSGVGRFYTYSGVGPPPPGPPAILGANQFLLAPPILLGPGAA